VTAKTATALPCLFVSAAMVLAACSGASEEPAAPQAPAPEAESAAGEAPAAEAGASSMDDAGEEMASPASAPAEADGTGEDDTEHGEEDHAEHGEDDHAEHDGDDHDHGDHAGGAPHVHGKATAAIVLDAETLAISFQTALASFGLSEEEPGDDAARAALDAALAPFGSPDSLVTLPEAAECALVEAETGADFSGAGDFIGDYTFSCAAPDALDEVRFHVFTVYPDLETIDAVWLAGNDQVSVTLTPDEPTITP